MDNLVSAYKACAEKVMKDDMRDILKLSEESLKKVWNNKKDDIWNMYKK